MVTVPGVAGVAKDSLSREHNQNDDRVSHHRTLLYLIQYLTIRHGGYFKDHWKILISTKNAHFNASCSHHNGQY